MCISTCFTWAWEFDAPPNNKTNPNVANEIILLIALLLVFMRLQL